MKSITMSKIIILTTLGILFFLLPIITNNLSFFTGISKNSSEYRDDKNSKLSKISERIQIINNSGWITFKNAGNCTGEGTYSDPYVIKDLVIDGGGSGDCILIENSNVNFRIEGCILSNSGTEGFNAGISLNNTDNGNLIDNDCLSNLSGIYLNECNNNTISGNSLNNNYGGIIFRFSSNNTVSGNSASYNNYTGIYLWGGDNNDITGNNLFSNDYGIRLWTPSCFDNNFSRNIISKNREYGIHFIGGTHDNSVYLNCFTENGINAEDSGLNNRWDNGTIGNYWSNYTGTDENGDGIGDVPHTIPGYAGSQDHFPLMECPLPVQGENGDTIPLEAIIIISSFSGGVVIGVATLLLLIRKRKRSIKESD